MEAFITAAQVGFIVGAHVFWVVTFSQTLQFQLSITYFLIEFQGDFVVFFLVMYALSMGSTAMAVFLGCSVEEPKLAQEVCAACVSIGTNPQTDGF